MFGNIANKNLSIPTFPSDPYGPEQLAKLLEVVPVRYGRRPLNAIYILFR